GAGRGGGPWGCRPCRYGSDGPYGGVVMKLKISSRPGPRKALRNAVRASGEQADEYSSDYRAPPTHAPGSDEPTTSSQIGDHRCMIGGLFPLPLLAIDHCVFHALGDRTRRQDEVDAHPLLLGEPQLLIVPVRIRPRPWRKGPDDVGQPDIQQPLERSALRLGN